MCSNAIALFNTKYIKGDIRFHQCDKTKGTLVMFNLYGMTPGKIRACHIHEYGDESDGCKSLGAHWNPDNTNHGYINLSIPYSNRPSHNIKSHAGDLLNNIKADKKGNFRFRYIDHRLNLRGNVNNSIFGRSVVIHDGVDDLGLGGDAESLKTGNAGGRIACSIIGHRK